MKTKTIPKAELEAIRKKVAALQTEQDQLVSSFKKKYRLNISQFDLVWDYVNNGNYDKYRGYLLTLMSAKGLDIE